MKQYNELHTVEELSPEHISNAMLLNNNEKMVEHLEGDYNFNDKPEKVGVINIHNTVGIMAEDAFNSNVAVNLDVDTALEFARRIIETVETIKAHAKGDDSNEVK
ncbi:TPA: hypothetical protein QCX06_002127 [Bacillus paranthracis]|nr:hypothetical protein [Bacillus paranthracis]HDR7304524.1 hypothetical protein [Bacillus paranthracis]